MTSIVVKNLSLDYPIYGASKSFRTALFRRATGGLINRDKHNKKLVTVRALSDVSFSLSEGDRLGVIGPNGAGKSTLLRALVGVYRPTIGSVKVTGKISSLLSVAPGIDPEDTGYENIVTIGLFLGMSRREIKEKTPDIEEFTELGEYLNLPVRTYSTGMQVRLGFAMATTLNPEILILDEGLGAGDARFAERAKKRAEALYSRSGITVVASHSNAIIKSMCNKALLLDGGNVVALGDVGDVLETYASSNKK